MNVFSISIRKMENFRLNTYKINTKSFMITPNIYSLKNKFLIFHLLTTQTKKK